MDNRKPLRHKTREAWLVAATKAMTKHFVKKTADLIADGKISDKSEMPEKLRFSCSFPFGSRKAVGQCWSSKASKDGTIEILVSPVDDDPVEVLSTLMHELCHAILPDHTGHGAPFKRLGLAVGLEGKPTSMGASKETREWLKETILPKLGEYPHARLTPGGLRKKQTTRLVKVECVNGTGYIARITNKWLDECGPPLCGCCGDVMDVAS